MGVIEIHDKLEEAGYKNVSKSALIALDDLSGDDEETAAGFISYLDAKRQAVADSDVYNYIVWRTGPNIARNVIRVKEMDDEMKARKGD